MCEDISNKFIAIPRVTLNIRAVKIGRTVIATGRCVYAQYVSGDQKGFMLSDDILPYSAFVFDCQCITNQGIISLGKGYLWSTESTVYFRDFGVTSGVSFSFSYIVA